MVKQLIRALVHQCLWHNILIVVAHIPGVNSSIDDALSFFPGTTFHETGPEAAQELDKVLPCLWDLGRQKLTGQCSLL